MLSEQTIDKLYAMNLQAMAEAFREQIANPQMEELSFPERFGLLVDRQWCSREERRRRDGGHILFCELYKRFR